MSCCSLMPCFLFQYFSCPVCYSLFHGSSSSVYSFISFPSSFQLCQTQRWNMFSSKVTCSPSHVALDSLSNQTTRITQIISLDQASIYPNNYLVWAVVFSDNVNYPTVHCKQWDCLTDTPLALKSSYFQSLITDSHDTISNFLGNRKQLKKKGILSKLSRS